MTDQFGQTKTYEKQAQCQKLKFATHNPDHDAHDLAVMALRGNRRLCFCELTLVVQNNPRVGGSADSSIPVMVP